MATPATYITKSIQAEDEDEWEYEYSATETETYYLTLDLPVRDFNKNRDEIVHNTRGGYRVWFNPNFNGPDDEETGRPLDQDEFDANNAENDTEHGGLNDGDDDDESTMGGGRPNRLLQEKRAASGEAQEPGDSSTIEPEQIQILGLHSKHPLISYRGTILRGSWAENIGTEMIFASHDPQGSLPVLRHLSEDLDLIAASSARVNFNHVELKPNQEEQSTGAEDKIGRYQQNGGVYIHVHSDKFGTRRPQADFLEDLTTLKRKRGEPDDVTIMPQDTPHNQLLEEDADEEIYRNKLEKDRVRRLHQKKLDAGEQAPGDGENGPTTPQRGRRRRGKRSRWG